MFLADEADAVIDDYKCQLQKATVELTNSLARESRLQARIDELEADLRKQSDTVCLYDHERIVGELQARIARLENGLMGVIGRLPKISAAHHEGVTVLNESPQVSKNQIIADWIEENGSPHPCINSKGRYIRSDALAKLRRMNDARDRLERIIQRNAKKR